MADILIRVQQLTQELELARAITSALLKNIGDPGSCRGCGLPIYWVLHRNGKKTPYDYDGTNHFATCVQAARFKKEKTNATGNNRATEAR